MKHAVKIKNLSVTLGGNKILKDISLDLPVGGIVGLLGPNGAGKTTLLRSIVGRLRPTHGSIIVLDESAGSSRLRAHIGYMTQTLSIYPDLTVQDNVRYFAAMNGQGKHDADKLIKTIELEHKKHELVSQLSGGQKSRMSLAIALLGHPKLIVLDEPTVGLDPLLRAKLWHLFRQLAKQGSTLIISSHVMDEAVRCDTLLLLREGKLLALNTPDELLKQTKAKTIEDSFMKLIGEES